MEEEIGVEETYDDGALDGLGTAVVWALVFIAFLVALWVSIT